MIVPILLVIASLAILILEVFLVSFGTLALVAITLGVTGIVLAFGYSSIFGWILMGVLFAGVPTVLWLAFRVLPSIGIGRSLYLKKPNLTEADRKAAAKPLTYLMGAIGEAKSPLRPSGTAVFEGKPMQVVTRGTLVPPGTLVKVVDVSGNRIVVEELEGSP
jgi:membrane-bound serine protease (ClpP class)